MGRPKLPVEVKRQRGTLRSYDNELVEQEQKLALILPECGLKVPKSITDPKVRKAYKNHIELLHSLGGMAEQKADSSLLEIAYLALQKAYEAQERMSNYDLISDEYEKAEKSFFRNVNKFESIAKDFYLTPKARMQLKLDVLTGSEKQMNIAKQTSAIGSLLQNKES